MNPVRVIGIGSPFGADALGLAAAERLRAEGLDEGYPPGLVAVETCDRCGVGLLEEIRLAGLAILIDAARFGAEAGRIRRFDDGDLEEAGTVRSSHTLGVAETLALGRALDVLPPRLILYGIEIGQEADADAILDIPEDGIAWLRTAIRDDIAHYLRNA